MNRGSNGATDEQMQDGLDMRGSTQRPRRVELMNMGLVIETNRKRKNVSGRNANVYVAAQYV